MLTSEIVLKSKTILLVFSRGEEENDLAIVLLLKHSLHFQINREKTNLGEL